MGRAFVGGRQTVRSAAAIGWYPVEAHRPIPIRRECDALAVWSPDGALIVPLERELLDLSAASKVVDPQDIAVIFCCLNDQLPSLR